MTPQILSPIGWAPGNSSQVGHKSLSEILHWLHYFNMKKTSLSFAENEEKFLLYVVISVLVGLVLLLLVIILRLVMRRHYHKTKAKLDISEPIANSTRAPEGTPLPQPETSLLLEDSVDNNNGIEMLSFQHSSSLHRPPPGSATLNRQVPVTSSLDRNGQFPRGGSPYYNNTFRTDSANRINNYYYTWPIFAMLCVWVWIYDVVVHTACTCKCFYFIFIELPNDCNLLLHFEVGAVNESWNNLWACLWIVTDWFKSVVCIIS